MSETTAPLVAKNRPASTPPVDTRAKRRRILIVSAVTIVLLVMAGIVTWNGDSDEPPGLVFTIPAGSAKNVAVPGIDSAIDIPTEITFAADDVAAISIVNNDNVEHRAGPFLVGPGQTYTQRFPSPGEYFIDCSVDPAESIAVIVEGGSTQ
ncbi:MAG: hypothetical protein IT336_02955 [Thermomicrobiales bacterium]|nr:hypothetical protein [Thermomicrobiales bacterium]